MHAAYEQLAHVGNSITTAGPRFGSIRLFSSPEAVQRPVQLQSPSAGSQQQGCHALLWLEALAVAAAAAVAFAPWPADDDGGVWHLVAL